MKTAVETVVILLIVAGVAEITHNFLVWFGALAVLYVLWQGTHPVTDSAEEADEEPGNDDTWGTISHDDWGSEIDDPGPK